MPLNVGREFFNARDQDDSTVLQWDAFKAYLRGLLIGEMNQVKHPSSALKMEVEARVQEMEQTYIANPSDSTREAWQAAQSAYQQLLSSTAKKRFFTKQAFFEEGEKIGRLLARIANSHQRSSAIRAFGSRAGSSFSQPELILQKLASFYKTLYSPDTAYS